MKNVTTGLGLCVLGVGIAAYPVLDHLVPRADAGAPRGGGAIVAAATGQVEPTIVWYQAIPFYKGGIQEFSHLYRAWSDGRIEVTRQAWTITEAGCYGWVMDSGSCGGTGQWKVLSAPGQGYNYRSDINFDSKVDGADLGTLLADWGDAPRHDIPPSDCPLNLIDP